MRKILTLTTLLLLAFVATAQQAKYVFYFIGDGLGINHIHGTELYNAAVHTDMENGGKLSFTKFPFRSYVTNHSSSSLVTDSSAAATALASGVKTVNGYMGVDDKLQPKVTLAERAADKGMKVGVATNVAVNHATPSAFYSHDESRSNYGSLFEQLLSSEVDFAAGSTILCKRTGFTVEQLMEQAEGVGIKVLQNPKEVAKVRKKRVLLLSPDLDEQALKYGVKLSGATVHFVSEECDGGPIIAQKSVEVRPDDTPEVLQKLIMEQAEWILLPQAVKAFCEDRITVDGRTVIIR